MKRLMILAVFALVMAGGSLAARAQETPPQFPPPGGRGGMRGTQMPSFAEMDKNKDGKISRDEWQGPAQLFDRIDENHDGFIDQDEWNRFRSQRGGGGGARFGESLMKFLDANHDGKVTREEFAKILQLFDALDRDHNGELTQEELGRFSQAVSEVQTQATGGVEVDNLFEKYDKNKDGKITPEELNNERMFKALDLNKDGVITRDEAEKALKDLAARSKQQKGTDK